MFRVFYIVEKNEKLARKITNKATHAFTNYVMPGWNVVETIVIYLNISPNAHGCYEGKDFQGWIDGPDGYSSPRTSQELICRMLSENSRSEYGVQMLDVDYEGDIYIESKFGGYTTTSKRISGTERYGEEVEAVCKKHGLDPVLVYEVVPDGIAGRLAYVELYASDRHTKIGPYIIEYGNEPDGPYEFCKPLAEYNRYVSVLNDIAQS